MAQWKERPQASGSSITSTDDVQKFIDCWNIYSGLFFETDGKINRRMEAMQKYTEMMMFLGGKSIEIADGVRVEPDYFPSLGEGGEFDWTMGFSLTMFNKPLGKIIGVAVHGGAVILTCESIVVGFKYRGDLGKIDP